MRLNKQFSGHLGCKTVGCYSACFLMCRPGVAVDSGVVGVCVQLCTASLAVLGEM